MNHALLAAHRTVQLERDGGWPFRVGLGLSTSSAPSRGVPTTRMTTAAAAALPLVSPRHPALAAADLLFPPPQCMACRALVSGASAIVGVPCGACVARRPGRVQVGCRRARCTAVVKLYTRTRTVRKCVARRPGQVGAGSARASWPGRPRRARADGPATTRLDRTGVRGRSRLASRAATRAGAAGTAGPDRTGRSTARFETIVSTQPISNDTITLMCTPRRSCQTCGLRTPLVRGERSPARGAAEKNNILHSCHSSR